MKSGFPGADAGTAILTLKSRRIRMKIKKTSLPDEICDSIKASIKNGEWKLQEKLPSENELSEMFGVNRLTIRMALQKLNSQGIVETRVGEGTYVKDFSFSTYIGEVSDFYLMPEMIDNVCEYRQRWRWSAPGSPLSAPPRGGSGARRCLRPQRRDQSEGVPLADWNSELLQELIERDLEFHYEIVNFRKIFSIDTRSRWRGNDLRYLQMIVTRDTRVPLEIAS